MSEILLTSRYLSVRRLDLTGVCLKKKIHLCRSMVFGLFKMQ